MKNLKPNQSIIEQISIKKQTKKAVNLIYSFYGEPGGVRTPDPALRRRVLYPTELLTHNAYIEYHLLITLSISFQQNI